MPEELDYSTIEDISITLRAELGHKTVSFSQLLNLDVGEILQLGRATGENVDFFAGDVRLGAGEIVIVDSTLAVRLADLSETGAERKTAVPKA